MRYINNISFSISILQVDFKPRYTISNDETGKSIFDDNEWSSCNPEVSAMAWFFNKSVIYD